ncbi:ATP-binding cassette domain-containing protein [Silvanigrella paludirubra]|uniref:ATP-binding cassette domain-containing protein n=1 Tax=Silvanigrella paludirubra TaxID=2499159 RepID=A0A6N6VSS6_9BACT|nr:ABC transporter ATP-binding protein [Silvanigrella paludirubra]KAB8038711.1 ATP-binding cassette domain-containing protein [Silvanigrella paludirubra]
MHPFKRLFIYAKSYQKDVILASIYSSLNKIFDIMPEILIGIAIDTVVNKQNAILSKLGISSAKEQILFLGIITALIWILESFFEYLYSIKWRNIAQNLQHDLRMDLYSHIQKLDISYFENKNTGNLLSILNDDINQIERFLNNGINSIIQVFLSSTLIGIIFFILTPSIAILSLVPIPFILFGAFYFQRKIGPKYYNVRENAGELNSILNNNILGISTIKSFTTENYEINRIKSLSNKYRKSNHEAIKISSAITPIIRMAVMMGFMLILIYGGFLTLENKLNVAIYSILIFLSQRLLWPLTGLSEITDNYQRSLASINRVMDLLKTPIKIIEQGERLNLIQTKGEIICKDLKFSYLTSPVLKNININILPGETVAFVGTTGSGKSTLLKLFLRFYEKTSGQILIDGKDISEINLFDLRKSIGYVSQDIFLINGTIAENIAYGSFHATLEEIKNAAKLAESHEFISLLESGYETKIGERGQKLSGGQRQRLAIARAILKNPPILILDEATSAVDNETELAIQKSLEKLVLGRTTILVAHRLSTIRHADKIFVFDHGEIMESGNHETLVMKKGIYSGLWSIQMGEKI